MSYDVYGGVESADGDGELFQLGVDGQLQVHLVSFSTIQRDQVHLARVDGHTHYV